MEIANILLIVFVVILAFLAMWWAFNTLRQIQLQREYAAIPLTSIAKLWRKAKYVPEDAKDRESLYLYRDFLAKFDEDECKYPIIVKNGGVRAMTRGEYDQLCGQKDKRPVSVLLVGATLVYAVAAVGLNLNNILLGVGLACIMPVWLIVLALFLNRFNREKNQYRNNLFNELKENSLDFLTITKPFIVVDAYPQQFGKNADPKFVGVGELTPDQIKMTKNYIVQQKAAETKVVMKTVDNQAEIDAIENPAPAPQTVNAPAQNVASPTVATAPVAPAPVETSNAENVQPLTNEEKAAILNKLVADSVQAQAERAAKREAQTQAPVEVIEELPPLEVGAAPIDPNADDFSLDSIGVALDAEIAKRRNKK